MVLKINVYTNYLIIKQWTFINNDVTKGENIWKLRFSKRLQIPHAYKYVYFKYLLRGKSETNKEIGEPYNKVSWVSYC